MGVRVQLGHDGDGRRANRPEAGADYAARARQPAQRRGDGPGRDGRLRNSLRQQHPCLDVVGVGRFDDDARLRRGDHFQQRFFRESGEVFGVVNGIDGAAELGLTPHLIDPFDLAELFPRRGHQLLLLSLHDLRAQRGDRSVARIEIQFIQPGRGSRRWGGNLHGVSRRLPAAVNRRREQRVLALLLHRLPRRIEDLFELGLKGRSSLFRPFGGWGIQDAQRAFKLERRARWQRGGDAESGLADVHPPFADFRRHLARFEQSHQRFEITTGAGAKLPVKIDRQGHLAGDCAPAAHAGSNPTVVVRRRA